MKFIAHTVSDIPGIDKVGGKGYHLYKLVNLGFRVPEFCVIPVGSEALTESELDDLWKHIGAEHVAVRSSAVEEDGTDHSFAGLFESYLFVNREQLAEKIKAVQASANSDRIRTYKSEFGIGTSTGVAVVVQKMVPAEVSGVAFGIDPVRKKRDTQLVSAVYGLGEGLVSGELDADNYFIEGKEIKSQLAQKESALVLDTERGGTRTETLDQEKRESQTLSTGQILELSGLLTKLGDHLGGPQDVEFAVENSTIYLLQTRVVTTKIPDGEYIVWDNSNIVESYPGVTTPLTYSFIIKMYEAVYRQFVGLLGVSKRTVADNEKVFANTLGLVRGRVYYNLLSWYKMLAMVPGYSINAQFMETMMGVKERFELDKDYRMTKGRAWLRILFMAFRLLWLHWRLPAQRRRFQRDLNTTMAAYHALNFNEMTVTQIMDHYNRFEITLLDKWKPPLTNDFFAMIWFGMLKKQSEKHDISDNPNIHNDLLCGSNDIISVEPVRLSFDIVSTVKQDPVWRSKFETETAEQIRDAVLTDPSHLVSQKINTYLERFGERCIGELKLESISYAQEPTRYIELIQSYLKQGVDTSQLSGDLEQEIRDKAEQEVAEAFKGKFFKRRRFNYVLRKARELVSNRENLRYERTRAFGMVRKMFLAMGERLAADGQLNNPRDVFYLELEELKALGRGEDLALKGLVEEREREFEGYRTGTPPAERFFTYGYEFSEEYIYTEAIAESEDGDLQGIGCSPGVVEARVQVIMDPTQSEGLNGDILVTRSTDPGWVTLFPTASAIVVEKGSLLSHSAIVSREMGIPCIVSVTGLLKQLKTGDKIRMNGSTGQIELLDG